MRIINTTLWRVATFLALYMNLYGPLVVTTKQFS